MANVHNAPKITYIQSNLTTVFQNVVKMRNTHLPRKSASARMDLFGLTTPVVHAHQLPNIILKLGNVKMSADQMKITSTENANARKDSLETMLENV